MLAISIGSRLGLPLAAGALALILIGLAQVPNATASQDAGAFVSKTGTQGIEALRSDVAPAERADDRRIEHLCRGGRGERESSRNTGNGGDETGSLHNESG